MKKGEVYKVFEDPYTKTKLEGSAKIISIDRDQFENDEEYYYCGVKFLGFDIGEPIVNRTINKNDLVK